MNQFPEARASRSGEEVDERPLAASSWRHWTQFITPAIVLSVGGTILVHDKRYIAQEGHPVVWLFLLKIVGSFVFCLRAGIRLAERFEPGRNKYVTGFVIGVAGFIASIVVGLLLLIILTADM